MFLRKGGKNYAPYLILYYHFSEKGKNGAPFLLSFAQGNPCLKTIIDA